MLDYYEILELNQDASLEDIKRSFKRLAFKYHPDVNPDNEEAKQKMVEILEAYDVLSDPISRNWYDIRGGERDVLSHFEEIYKSYVQNKTRRHEKIKYDIEADRKEVRDAYEKANGTIPIRWKILIYSVLFILGLEGMMQTIILPGYFQTSVVLIFVFIFLLVVSFIKIANLLYLESLKNKYFKPEGKLREAHVPFIMLVIFIFGLIRFFSPPEFIAKYFYSDNLIEINVPYIIRDYNVFYHYDYKGRTYYKEHSINSVANSDGVDSLRSHFSSLHPDKSEIIGLWSNGILIPFPERFPAVNLKE